MPSPPGGWETEARHRAVPGRDSPFGLQCGADPPGPRAGDTHAPPPQQPLLARGQEAAAPRGRQGPPKGDPNRRPSAAVASLPCAVPRPGSRRPPRCCRVGRRRWTPRRPPCPGGRCGGGRAAPLSPPRGRQRGQEMAAAPHRGAGAGVQGWDPWEGAFPRLWALPRQQGGLRERSRAAGARCGARGGGHGGSLSGHSWAAVSASHPGPCEALWFEAAARGSRKEQTVQQPAPAASAFEVIRQPKQTGKALAQPQLAGPARQAQPVLSPLPSPLPQPSTPPRGIAAAAALRGVGKGLRSPAAHRGCAPPSGTTANAPRHRAASQASLSSRGWRSLVPANGHLCSLGGVPLRPAPSCLATGKEPGIAVPVA